LCRIVQRNDLNQAVTLKHQYNSWIQLDDGIKEALATILTKKLYVLNSFKMMK